MLGFCPAHLISSEVFEDDTLYEAACGELTHDNVRYLALKRMQEVLLRNHAR